MDVSKNAIHQVSVLMSMLNLKINIWQQNKIRNKVKTALKVVAFINLRGKGQAWDIKPGFEEHIDQANIL